MRLKIGVLGLQGDFREHIEVLQAMNIETVVVKLPKDLDLIDGLIIPGGESTTMGRILESLGMKELLIQKIQDGMPVYGTCAGMILLSKSVVEYEQPLLRVLDVRIERNAYGRQVESFEADLNIPILGEKPFRAIFIRAPRISEYGKDVEILASYDSAPVFVRQGNIMVTAFHPELTQDFRIHELFLKMVKDVKG